MRANQPRVPAGAWAGSKRRSSVTVEGISTKVGKTRLNRVFRLRLLRRVCGPEGGLGDGRNRGGSRPCEKSPASPSQTTTLQQLGVGLMAIQPVEGDFIGVEHSCRRGLVSCCRNTLLVSRLIRESGLCQTKKSKKTAEPLYSLQFGY